MARGEVGGRRGPKVVIGILVVLALLWCGYWYAASRAVFFGTGRLVEAFAARGQSITCAQSTVGGFPLALALDCRQAAYSDPRSKVSASLAGVTANAPLYWPGAVTASLSGPLQLAGGANRPSLTVTWAGAVGSAEAGLRGLKSVAATFDGLAVAPDSGTPLPLKDLTASHADLSLTPGEADAYQLSANGSGIAITLADGRALPKLGVDTVLTALNFGPALGTDPKAAIRAWINAGGGLRVDRLVVSLGASSVESTGNLSLSKAGSLSGTLTVRLTGLDQLPDIAEQFRPGSHDKVANVVAMVSAVAKPVPGGNNAYEIPLALVNGTVTLGGIIPIATIPPLKF